MKDVVEPTVQENDKKNEEQETNSTNEESCTENCELCLREFGSLLSLIMKH